jgi:DNA-binding transcriptional regulator YiaG
MTPVSLDVALSVQAELLARTEEADRIRRQQLERARYEAELARRRYLGVDPENRLVAGQLEADWNACLRQLEEAHKTYESQRKQDRRLVDEALRAEMLSLTKDLPRLWQRAQDRERKRIVRLIVEDVTLMKDEESITLQVRFRGGAARTLHLPRPKSAVDLRRTSPDVIHEIDRLLEHHLEVEVAEILNNKGLKTSTGHPFSASRIKSLRRDHGLKTRYERLRARDLLTSTELAARLGSSAYTVRRWHRQGLIRGHAYAVNNRFLYEWPHEDAHTRLRSKELMANDTTLSFDRPTQ